MEIKTLNLLLVSQLRTKECLLTADLFDFIRKSHMDGFIITLKLQALIY